MEVTEVNGQLCVQLDAGSIFTGYESYISSFNQSDANISYDITSQMFSSTQNEVQGILNYYGIGDELLAYQDNSSDPVINFPVP